jgi:OmpA-OmpF porin, OOP family
MSVRPYLACLGFCIVACLVSVAPASAQANLTLPLHLGFLHSVMTVKVVDREDWTEVQFPPSPWGEAGPDTLKQGKHWHIWGAVNGNSGDKHVTWATLKRGFLAAGWVVVKEFDSQPLMSVLHFKKNGVDVWADVSVGDPPNETMEVLEVAPLPIALALAPPAPAPEQVDPAKGDFPYLTPLPGSKLLGGDHDPGSFYVTLTGASQSEIVATGSINKTYRPADGVSLLEWFTVYHDALLKAGWTIAGASHSGDGAITAHYGKSGRNIWAYLHNGGGTYSFRVGDEGGGGLGAGLAKDCHVALTGVLFDFNKSTLKPESDAVLEGVRGLMARNAALKLEVQGHTDNVGTDVYNQGLSVARAAAVVAWLTQHGVAAGRLSAKGYGKALPVADNRTDEGRTKNRRVEIANLACTPQRK